MTYELLQTAIPYYIAGFVGVGVVLVLDALARRRSR